MQRNNPKEQHKGTMQKNNTKDQCKKRNPNCDLKKSTPNGSS